MNDPVNALLADARGFVIAAAGCGKTHTLASFVASEDSGRQLVLTHTHAGVAAIRKRLKDFGVSANKYRVDTIAGWCLRYAAAYPSISGMQTDCESDPNWDAIYPAMEKVLRSGVGKRILQASYDGVLIDEYQDCSVAQHAVTIALACILPVRAFGDPMQAVFNFQDAPCVTEADMRNDFEVVATLTTPWRWERQNCSSDLGTWLVSARQQLQEEGFVDISDTSPVGWKKYDGMQSWADAAWEAAHPAESTVVILKWPTECLTLAKRLAGKWPIVEKFDHQDLFELSRRIAAGDGVQAAKALFEFLKERATKLGTDLTGGVNAITEGRSIKAFKKYRDHIERLERISQKPTPSSLLAFLEGALNEPEWYLYRRECVYQLRSGLRECVAGTVEDLPDAVAAARVRARHRGRLTHRRTIGTPLLVKGLEYDHAIVCHGPNSFDLEGLYVALTRASKSLTVVSRSRRLVPAT